MHQFEQELTDSGKMPIFEIPVRLKRLSISPPTLNNEKEYILCEIGVNGNKLEATREGLTRQEIESDKIAFDSVDIDLDFSLDHHLQELYDEVINSICNSELFELAELPLLHSLRQI